MLSLNAYWFPATQLHRVASAHTTLPALSVVSRASSLIALIITRSSDILSLKCHLGLPFFYSLVVSIHFPVPYIVITFLSNMIKPSQTRVPASSEIVQSQACSLLC